MENCYLLLYCISSGKYHWIFEGKKGELRTWYTGESFVIYC